MLSLPQDLADANLIEAVREHARWQEPCSLSEEGGVLLMAGANAFPGAFRNCVLRLDPRVPPSVVLERAQSFFQSHDRGYTLLARASRDGDLIETLQMAGMTPLANSPCMLVESRVAEAVAPAGIRIERLGELRHVQDVVRINAEAYEALRLPSAETHVFFGKPQALLSPRVSGFLAYRGGEAVSTALTIHSGAGAGVYWVGTAASAQRMGLAELCTRLATNAGFAAGARVVTLQASPLGEPIYRRMGYRNYDRQLRFRFPVPAA